MKTNKGHDVVEDFPIFSANKGGKHHLVYLDSAATTQKPRAVIETMSNFYLFQYGTVHRAIYQLAAESTDLYSQVREKVKTFLNAAHEEEIIFTSGTTDSINLVARTFTKAFMKKGDQILISASEHHANIVPWQMMQEEMGIELLICPNLEDGSLDLESFKKLLSKKVKLVSMAFITNTTGALYPVKEIAELSHCVGAKVLVDAAQAAGHIEIDVKHLDVDFLAFSAHKMYGPTGIGVLYGKKELLEKMPPHKGGGDMIESVSFEKTTYQRPPLRFEAGTPMIAEAIGFGAALDYINSIGVGVIYEHEQKLLRYATEKLKKIPGVKILGNSKHKGAIITFILKGMHPLDVGTILNLKSVAIRTGQMCAEPLIRSFGISSAMRISFGVYNTEDEIDYFIKMLEETIVLLKKELSF